MRGYLDSHPNVVCRNELFNLRRFQPDCYTVFIRKSKWRKIVNIFYRRLVVRNFLDRSLAESGCQAVGFKYMYTDAKLFPYKFPMVLDYVKSRTVKVIHLKRTNVLKTLVSRISAAKTGIYHSVEAKRARTKIYVPVNTLLPKLQTMKNEQKRWDRRLIDINHISILYEDFVQEPEAIGNQISEFLGVEKGYQLKSRLKKLNPDDLSNIIENYVDIEANLRGSVFEWCLDT